MEIVLDEIMDAYGRADGRADSPDDGNEWIGLENGRLVKYRYVDGKYHKTGYLLDEGEHKE